MSEIKPKKYCCCCGRQFVTVVWDHKIMVSGSHVIFMGTSKYCCSECGQDLDENGIFPEEH